MMTFTLSDELEQKVQQYMTSTHTGATMQEVCEMFIARGVEEQESAYHKPTESDVKERLQSLGYID